METAERKDNSLIAAFVVREKTESSTKESHATRAAESFPLFAKAAGQGPFDFPYGMAKPERPIQRRGES